MIQSLFYGLFDTDPTSVIGVGEFLLCILCALLAGAIIAGSYMYRTRFTKSFVTTLALLPAAVCVVIMMVNGNVGAGVAVAGAFGLVRFRSVPGTAKEIGMIFIAMGSGLISGMGYLAYAMLFTVVMCAIFMLYSKLDMGAKKNAATYKIIHITIPEDLDYSEVFEEIFEKYTTSYELVQVKTTNLGSLFRLTYDVMLREPEKEKELIDQLRCRNGNLEIAVSKQVTASETL